MLADMANELEGINRRVAVLDVDARSQGRAISEHTTGFDLFSDI
jgi:hypothetical protein